MTRQYDFHRSNESSQKDDDNWILQRSAVRSQPARTLTPQTESTAGDRSGIKLDLTQIPVSNYSAIPVQAKLEIGPAGDKYEQEADRVAKQVVQQLHGSQPRKLQQQQTQLLQENPEVEEELQRKPRLQLKGDQGGMAAAPELESSITRSRGSGQPLSEGIREPMEKAFGGVDFSGVKVHTDGQSDRLNRSIQAKAFTTGQDIFFRQEAYAPKSRGGQETIAHELTHVVQQNGGKVQRSQSPQRCPANDISSASEGETAIQRLTAGNPPPFHNDEPIRSDVHEVTETVTNSWGKKSDTKNFAHQNNSKYLDNHKIYYKKKEIGDLKTQGSDDNTLVKMHLVNSYLNPKANNWEHNWVWGSKTLNGQHSQIEDQAKLEHPEKKAENESMNYETEAVGAPTTETDQNELEEMIYCKSVQEAQKLASGLKIPSDKEYIDEITIKPEREGEGYTIADFFPRWQTGVSKSGTTGVQVRYQVAKKEHPGAWDPSSRKDGEAEKKTDAGKYQLYVRITDREQLIKEWIDLESGRSKRRKGEAEPSDAEPSSKKRKIQTG